MTVCIAATCEQGQYAIMAADRMVTSGLMIEFEHESPKIERLSDLCFAATAGDALAHTELFDGVHRTIDGLRKPTVEQVAETIKVEYQRVRQQKIAEIVLMPRGLADLRQYYEVIGNLPSAVLQQIEFEISQCNYELDILLVGRSYSKARIYHIKDPGTSACWDAIHFHVIGSGYNLAAGSLIGNGYHCGMDLPEALMVLLEARGAAKNAPGVGQATDALVVSPECGLTIEPQIIDELYEISHSKRSGSTDWRNRVIDLLQLPASAEDGNGANDAAEHDMREAKAQDPGGIQGEDAAD